MSASEMRRSVPFARRIAHLAVATILVAIAVCGSHPAARAGKTTLPGGASSLNETFQDWQVACAVRDKVPGCVVVQEQHDRQSRRLVLAVRFAPADKDGVVSGTLVLPFGLLLSAGATLQAGGKPLGQPMPFRTCLPAGCIVLVTLDKAMLEAARNDTSLKVGATMSETGQSLTFTISTKGLAAALDRAKALASE